MPDRVGKVFGNLVNISGPGQPLPRLKKALLPEPVLRRPGGSGRRGGAAVKRQIDLQAIAEARSPAQRLRELKAPGEPPPPPTARAGYVT